MPDPKSLGSIERDRANFAVSRRRAFRSFSRKWPRKITLAPTEQGSTKPSSPSPTARAAIR